MIVHLVTRHDGAAAWLWDRVPQIPGVRVTRHRHLDPAEVRAGDFVLGTLPADMAAAVCAAGAHYLHLAVPSPAEARGREWSAATLERMGAHLVALSVMADPKGAKLWRSLTHPVDSHAGGDGD